MRCGFVAASRQSPCVAVARTASASSNAPCKPSSTGPKGRHDILDKRTAFHRAHDTGMTDLVRDLQAAIGQLPQREDNPVAQPLHDGGRKSRTTLSH